MFRPAASLALAVSGLIALSSCSSGQPASAASPRNTSTSPAAASRATASVRIRFLTEVFATPLPADPAKAKVIEGFRQSQILWDQATEELVITPSTTEYVTGRALASLRTAVESSARDGIALAGTDRLYDTRVTSLTADSATVTSCDDGSQTSVEDLATLQKFPSNTTSPQALFVIWQMAPVGAHWAIASIDVISPPDPRAKAC